MSITASSAGSLSLSLFILLAAGLTAKYGLTSPNPPPPNPWKQDRIRFVVRNLIWLRYALFTGLAFYHGLLAYLDPGSRASVCPCADQINPFLFEWNWYTVSLLSFILLIGCPLRYTAYGGLGKWFTFDLAQPGELCTTGIYAYVQHPSYTGEVFIVGGNVMLFFRWDGVLGCWISESMRVTLAGWGLLVYVVTTLLAMRATMHRVIDEEGMLKETFGVKWERWHQSTARFIPQLF